MAEGEREREREGSEGEKKKERKFNFLSSLVTSQVTSTQQPLSFTDMIVTYVPLKSLSQSYLLLLMPMHSTLLVVLVNRRRQPKLIVQSNTV